MSTLLFFITSAEQGDVFTSVSLSVCPSDNWKSCERILTEFLGGVGHDPGTNEFNFGDDPDHRPDPWVRSPKSAFTGLSKKLPTDFDEILWRAGVWPRDQLITSGSPSGSRSPKSGSTGLSIMLAFGGGLRSLSTCSLFDAWWKLIYQLIDSVGHSFHNTKDLHRSFTPNNRFNT